MSAHTQQLHAFDLTLDCVPYQFLSTGDGTWGCQYFTAFDIKVKSRFTEKYVGKEIDLKFLFITHVEEEDTLTIDCPDGLTIEQEVDLIESFFSIYFDALKEIGYETLDPEPQ